ncbi:outer membrane lipoprotein-sorting protein [Aquincola sp. MAHUQ-54]|uniref:Outer membrane lipoprotein-sorting protein n=1 Tax=Aquincola agrisoli TaxID=3119538 RepID=A0AAW9QEP8_9BURK
MRLAHAAPDPQELLRTSDAIRNPVNSFSLTSTLTEYRGGKRVDSSTLAIYSKPDKASGLYGTLIRFLAPARDQGKLMLKNGNELWFYDPANRAGIRISPEQRLLGQAANGDVATVNLARDYKAQLVGEEDTADGERKQRRCHKLLLDAAAPDVTYRRIEMWLDVADARPVKARFFADGDRLLKTAYYRRFQQELGAERPTEIVIIDGIDTGWVTVMRYSDYAWRDVPDAWMQRDYLPRFRPE